MVSVKSREPSEEKRSGLIQPWPFRVCTASPVAISHSTADPVYRDRGFEAASSPERGGGMVLCRQASVLLSGEKAMAFTQVLSLEKVRLRLPVFLSQSTTSPG